VRWSTPPSCTSPLRRASSTAQIERAKAEDVLYSVHLKATMMKVSDPIIFGHVVQTFLPALFDEFGDVLRRADINPNDGLGNLLVAAARCPRAEAIKDAVQAGWTPVRAWRWSTRTGHHQPARPVGRHRRRLDAGDDPHVRSTCGDPTATRTTRSPSSRTAPMPASTRP
jgi:hypothetical protein